jgi:sensor histidine kinase YesM
MPHAIVIQLVLLLGATALLAVAMMLLSFYNRLFRRVQNKWIRRNLAVISVALIFMSALLMLQAPESMSTAGTKGLIGLMIKQLGFTVIIVLFVFNITWLVSLVPSVKSMSFVKQHVIIISTIVISCLVIYTIINYVDNGMKFSKLHATLVFAYFNAVATGLIYTAINYVELDRKRKLNEKELEVTRLIALKTKAELDALHSKVNPHFLYNALNSIADLSITDGKKARRMTIALADLFRYSINYSNNNYSNVSDEVGMTEVYLQIEKIRFEDQLNYSVSVGDEVGHYLVPRFILQPLVENAVKHGLKVTGQMTEIFLEVRKEEEKLVINIADNGPLFPEQLSPGYGVKSVFDKLDLLFPQAYEIHFVNQPRKQVSIHIHKLVKNEPGV